MMATVHQLLFIVFLSQPGRLFNIDPLDVRRFYMASMQPDALFGFAVSSFLDHESPFLLVGAPRARCKQGTSSGRVYKFDVKYNNKKFLEPNTIYGINRVPIAEDTNRRKETDHQRGRWAEQWLGASVATASTTWNKDGIMMMCAPRFETFGLETNSSERLAAVGECAIYLGARPNYRLIYPCVHVNDGSCVAGFSSGTAVIPKRQLVQVALGMPGSLLSEGNVFLGTYRENGQEVNRVVMKTSREWINKGFGLGYAVVLTNLRPKEKSDNDVVASCPWWIANDYRGVIVVADQYLNIQNAIIVNDTIGHVASFFGYSLAVADFNGDGIGDIAVGAPFLSRPSEDLFDVGRTYVYYGRSDDGLYGVDPTPTILDGPQTDARFGWTLANAGDLDRDGVEDLAVGCPGCGEDGKGAVFFFYGRHGRRLSTHATQVIALADYEDFWFQSTVDPRKQKPIPRDPSSVLWMFSKDIYFSDGGKPNNKAKLPWPKSFGSALSGRVDLDQSGTFDMVVGDPTTNSVIFLHTRPTARLEILNISSQNSIDLSSCSKPNCYFFISFSARLTSNVTRIHGMITNYEFYIEVDLDSGVTEDDQKRAVLTVNSKNKLIRSLELNHTQAFNLNCKLLWEQVERNKILPLRPKVTFKPKWPQAKYNFSQRPLILRPDSVLNFTIPDINFGKKSCFDIRCRSNFVLTLRDVTKDGYNGVLYYGERRRARHLILTLRNAGDPAYLPHVNVSYPIGVDCQPPNGTDCWEASDGDIIRIRCRLKSPWQQNEWDEMRFVCSPSTAVLGELIRIPKEINITAEVTSNNGDTIQTDNYDLVSYTIRVASRLSMALRSRDTALIDSRNNSLRIIRGQRLNVDAIGPRLTQVFTITNHGPSPIEELRVNLSLPLLTADGYPLIYIMDRVKDSEGWINVLPRILNERNESRGSCFLDTRFINQLKLTGFLMTTRNRRSVDREEEVQLASSSASWSILESEGTRQNEVIKCGIIDGKFAALQCAIVRCTAYNISRNEVVRVAFDGWLWARTFFRLKTSDLQVHIELSAEPVPTTYGLPVSSLGPPAKLNTTQTVIFTGITKIASKKVALWPIILAVVLGFVALLVITGLLWMCGFFKRKRRVDWEDKHTEM